MILSTQTDVMLRVHGPIEGVEKLCRAGYDGIDYSLFHDAMAQIESLGDGWRAQADAQRMAALSFGATFVQAHAPFGGPRERYLAESVSRFPLAFAYAARLGVRNVVVHPIQERPYACREEELFRMNVEFYRELLPMAREYDVVIAVENMWLTHPGTDFIADDVCADPRELARYVDELDSPYAVACLDIGHVGLVHQEDEAWDFIRHLGHDRLQSLHIHDNDYLGDGHATIYSGKIDWRQVTQALGEIDYQGDFTYEVSGTYFKYMEDDFLPVALQYLGDTAKHLQARIEAQRIQ